MRWINTFTCLALLLCFSCTKRDITIEQNHVNETIDDNTAPPFNGVSTIQIQNYINKAFIDLIGREAVPEEMNGAIAILEDNDLNDESKDALINYLMGQTDYYLRFWDKYSGQLLEGSTLEFVNQQVYLYQNAYDQAVMNGDEVSAYYIQMELDQLSSIIPGLQLYAQRELDINDLFFRMINNPIYDDINMGSENLVISCFENLFKRSPTEEELEAGVIMVSGFATQLLFKEGNNKDDFLEIMTTVPEFYQGLTIDIYNQLLVRDPSSEEMVFATNVLQAQKDYREIQRMVMKTEEYQGF